jgi:hypothetical protein
MSGVRLSLQQRMSAVRLCYIISQTCDFMPRSADTMSYVWLLSDVVEQELSLLEEIQIILALKITVMFLVWKCRIQMLNGSFYLFIQLLTFWRYLSSCFLLKKSQVPIKFQSPKIGTSSFDWAQLSRLLPEEEDRVQSPKCCF